jgi:hypothetical protein
MTEAIGERPLVWVTQDGKRLRPEDMTPQHRNNVINMKVRQTIKLNTDKAMGFDLFIGGDSMGSDRAFGTQESLLDFVSKPDEVRAWVLKVSPVLRRMAELNGELP